MIWGDTESKSQGRSHTCAEDRLPGTDKIGTHGEEDRARGKDCAIGGEKFPQGRHQGYRSYPGKVTLPLQILFGQTDTSTYKGFRQGRWFQRQRLRRTVSFFYVPLSPRSSRLTLDTESGAQLAADSP